MASSRARSDAVLVTLRLRPLSKQDQKGDTIVWYAEGDKTLRNVNHATAYAFDRVFGPSTESAQVYSFAARPVVKAAMEGINGTVLAYGGTSSGKTYTMLGGKSSMGVVPSALLDVFNMIEDIPGKDYLIRVSYLEIYNEVINDLLDPSGQNLQVREDAQGTYVEGIKKEVSSFDQALSFIIDGQERRHGGSKNNKMLSSRSHAIITLEIESSPRGDKSDGLVVSKLDLIDLAGSVSSKTETSGLRKKEGACINRSLLALGTVLGKLSGGKGSHIPYRDSKLTRVLKSVLSGHQHVSLICTASIGSRNVKETFHTLEFASSARIVFLSQTLSPLHPMTKRNERERERERGRWRRMMFLKVFFSPKPYLHCTL